MIDLEKLTEAHELVQKFSEKSHTTCSLKTIYMPDGTYACYYQSANSDNSFFELDDFISKLKYLTDDKPKFDVMQEVWFIVYANEWVIISAEINSFNPKTRRYHVAGNWWPEHQLYASKRELIESQIDYWQNKLGEELEQHCIVRVIP